MYIKREKERERERVKEKKEREKVNSKNDLFQKVMKKECLLFDLIFFKDPKLSRMQKKILLNSHLLIFSKEGIFLPCI